MPVHETRPEIQPASEPAEGRLRLIGGRTLGCLVALLALELGLGHFGGFGKWTVQERDRFVGWRMLPSQHAWSRDLTVPELINAHGFRDREWGPAPPAVPAADSEPGETRRDPTLFRVAVVGNSMTFGTSVPVEQTWPRVLERLLDAELQRRGDARRALVMNFAVQGYVFEQMARSVEANVRRLVSVEYSDDPLAAPVTVTRPHWRPDLLIVPTIPHDIAPMLPGTDEPAWIFRDFVLRTAIHDFLVDDVIDRWIPAPRQASSETVKQLKWIDRQIQAKPFEQENMRYWMRTGARLAGLRAMIEADGGRLALVNLPVIHPLLNPEAPTTSLRWKPWAEAQNSIPGRPAVVQVEPIGVFREAMAGLLPELRAGGLFTAERGGRHIRPDLPHVGESVFLLDDIGHYNARGHELLATYLAHVLVAAGVLDPREN